MSRPPAITKALDRLVSACRDDDRIVAVFVAGSYARGEADANSDVDVGIVTTVGAYDEVVADRAALASRCGEVAMCEDFDLEDFVFVMLTDGTEVEIGVAPAGEHEEIFAGPIEVLLDRGVLGPSRDMVGPEPDVTATDEQRRLLVAAFWHDLSHFVAAFDRGHTWWAYGQLAELRRQCMELARLTHQPDEPAEGFDKVDLYLSADDLEPFDATLSGTDRAGMLAAAHALMALYTSLARPLAAAHGLDYRTDLEDVMTRRLAALRP